MVASVKRGAIPVVALAITVIFAGGWTFSSGKVATHRAALKSATLELDWVPNPDHVGIFYALKKGFFQRAGVSVAVHSPSNATDPIKLVATGKVDLAVSYEGQMFLGQPLGLPVTTVAPIVTLPLNGVIVRPGISVSKLSDLKGRTFGWSGVPSTEALLNGMLKAAGLAPTDVKTIVVNQGLVPALLAGKVDAIIGGYRNVERIQIQQQTKKSIQYFSPTSYGIPNYDELVLVANSKKLTSDPAYADLVRRVVRGLVLGTEAAMKSPQAATAVMEQSTQYTKPFLKASIPYTLNLLAGDGGTTKWGCMPLSQWTRFGAWMKAQGLTKAPNAAALTTNKYLPHAC